MRSMLLITLILALCAGQASAAVLVNPDGTGDFPTIQAAIYAASPGDIIYLGDGTFMGPGNRDLDTNEENFTLESLSGDPTLCVIDCQGSQADPHFGLTYLGQDGTSVLRGISIINGYQNPSGGAIKLENASPTIENCIFADNTAENFGGAIYSWAASSPYLIDCTFRNNSAVDFGEGGAYHGDGQCSPTIEFCTFDQNNADSGAALYFANFCFPTVNRSTFVGNTGSALHLAGGSDMDMVRSILAFNDTVASGLADTNTLFLSCSDVFGNTGGNYVGLLAGQLGVLGNFEANPLFCHQASGDYSLNTNSPCTAINSGGCGQLGSQPVGCSATIIVAADGSGDYPTIQDAINAAVSFVDIIGLEDGTYIGEGNRDIDFMGKFITLRSLSDTPENCTIYVSGSEAFPHRGLILQSGEGLGTVIRGLMIMRGWHLDGAGIYIANGANPRIENCIIQRNTGQDGVGILVETESFATIVNCDFHDNYFDPTMNGNGGALVVGWHGGVSVSGCTFKDNGLPQGAVSEGTAGAVYMHQTQYAAFEDCIFESNRATIGGAVYSSFENYSVGSVTYDACTFQGNEALGSNGGSVFGLGGSENWSLNLTNSLLGFNKGTSWLYLYNPQTLLIQNTNIFGNEGGDWVGGIADQLGTNGNILAHPKFCDMANGDLYLEATSPCLPGSPANPAGVLMGALGEGCDYRGLVASVQDVPNDQGRRVRVSWNSSSQDAYGTPYGITGYSVWRRIDDPARKAGPAPEGAPDRADKFPQGNWDYVTTVPARTEYQYNVLCETVADSTVTDGIHWSTFFVSAETADPGLFFDSLPDSGYSVDNLAPATPGNLRLQGADLLAWEEVADPDFNYFTAYGSQTGHLDGSQIELGTTTGLQLDITGASYPFLLLTATDFSGNEGQPAVLATTSAAEEQVRPTQFALYPAWPNPGKRGTTLSFDLPKASKVSLAVYDVAGRRVATLLNSEMPAGTHHVPWTGESSRPLASGVYFYRLQADGFTDSGRVMILK